MTITTLLGGLTPARFLREYWHKKPLLVRQALPGMTPPLPRAELFGLAARDEVESRLVTHFDDEWQMQSGPFKKLPPPERSDWTLLVQGADLHHDAAAALLRHFRFISDARLDDLMISYASDGGGVGPHFDSYDVFLLQVHGQRRWRIGAQQDLALQEGLPLKILRDFQPEQEFILEPGDMLYLPPHYAHDGVALGECMTYSIGFRAPTFQELGEAFLEFMADTVELPGRYADPDAKPARHPAELPRAMITQVAEQFARLRFGEEDIAIFLGEYLSEPKPLVYFDPPEPALAPKRFAQTAARRGIVLSRKTRMLYRGRHLFINGESFMVGATDKTPLAQLADERRLEGAMLADGSEDFREALYLWYQDGWLHLAEK
ncbi:MAG: JmjC domain-containing protein [Noviherbaspirillum sp.]